MINRDKYLNTGLEKLNIELSNKVKQDLLTYMDKVLAFNKFVNLTSICDEGQFIELHILDSLTLIKYLPENARVIDVGTGGGFPGAVLKIARADVHVTFVDSVAKKLNFVCETLSQLGQQQYACVNARAETLAADPYYRQTFDICVSRAVSALPVLVELCIPFVKKGGRFIAMKGNAVYEEIETLGDAYLKLADINLHTYNLSLPFSSAQRVLAVYEINSAINMKYPRPFKEIKRSPLGSAQKV